MCLHSGPQACTVVVHPHCFSSNAKSFLKLTTCIFNHVYSSFRKWLYFCPIICPATSFLIVSFQVRVYVSCFIFSFKNEMQENFTISIFNGAVGSPAFRFFSSHFSCFFWYLLPPSLVFFVDFSSPPPTSSVYFRVILSHNKKNLNR